MMNAYSDRAADREWISYKLRMCVRTARECSRNTWREHNWRPWQRLKREAMADAREWKCRLDGIEEYSDK